MTLQEREDRFIKRLEKEWGHKINPDSRILLRYGFSAGASEMSRDAYDEGVQAQRENVLTALFGPKANPD